MGTDWVPPNESLIPLKDFPLIYYNTETRLTSSPDQKDTFSYVLKTNLTQLTKFCSMLQHRINQKHSIYRHYQRHIPSEMLDNNTSSLR